MPTNLHAIRQGLTEIGSGLQSMSEGVQRIISALPFEVDAVNFDGTNDYLLKTTALSGVSDSRTGIFSCWLNMQGGDGTNQDIYAADGDGSVCTILRRSANIVRVTLANNLISSAFQFASTETLVVADGWTNVLISWDTNAAAGLKTGHLYFNDADASVSVLLDSSAAFDVDYVASEWAAGASTSASRKLNADMAELYFAPGQFLDFSVEANRRLFIDAGGKPVDLGSDGSTPTGAAPAVYFSVLPGDAASDFATNRATGGNFTETGTLALAGTSPSD